jgi:hypothetical protein
VTSTITPSWSGTLLHASVRVGTQTNEEFWIDDAELTKQGAGNSHTKCRSLPAAGEEKQETDCDTPRRPSTGPSSSDHSPNPDCSLRPVVGNLPLWPE